MDDDDKVWAAVATAVGLAAASLARKALSKSWTKRRGVVPNAPGVESTLTEAVVFAMVSGVVVSLARLLAQRAVGAARARRTPNSGSA